MSLTIRRASRDDLPAMMRTLGASFLDTTDPATRAEFVADYWDFERVWLAADGPRVVGTLRSWPTELTLPGLSRLPGSAIAAVTVAPTDTRRGALRGLMDAELAAARERGEALALLYASEWPIYGRFGFGPATESVTRTLDGRGAVFLGDAPPGTLELVDRADVLALVRPIFDAHRAIQPGAISRLDRRWALDVGHVAFPGETAWRGWTVVHRAPDGTPDGYAMYRAEDRWTNRRPDAVLTIDQLHAVTPAAYAALWRYLAGVDLATTLKAEGRPPVEPLPWLLNDARAVSETERGEALWVAVLDPARALEARSYERADRLVIEVVGGGGAGGSDAPTRIELDASPDGAGVVPVDRPPDLTVHASAIGAAYLGGTPLSLAVLQHGFDEHVSGALARADALFRTLDLPWCSTHF